MTNVAARGASRRAQAQGRCTSFEMPDEDFMGIRSPCMNSLKLERWFGRHDPRSISAAYPL